MKNITRQGILTGAGILGLGITLSFAQAAPARKDVKDARQDVRHERRDVRRADTPAERRHEKAELRDEKRELRDAQKDLKRQRHTLKQRRVVRVYHTPRRRMVRVYHVGGRRVVRVYYVPVVPVRRVVRVHRVPVVPVRRIVPVYRVPIRSGMRTLEGTVTADLPGNAFTMRATNGQFLRVQSRAGEPMRLSRGDYVRIFGFSSNGIFHAEGLNLLNNR